MPCVKCSRNSEVRKLRDMSLWKLPKVLVVHLKRFLVQGWDKQKIESKVRIPLKLKMADFAPHSDDKSTLQPNYRLYGICHHVGNLKFGHYTAHVMTSEGEWLYCNDQQISKVDSLGDESIDSASAYLLFYYQLPQEDNRALL